MKKGLAAGNQHLGLFLTAILSICILVGCGRNGNDTPELSAAVDSTPTPTVDMDRARQAFDNGGELTYEEIRALRNEIVGEPPESSDFQSGGEFDSDKYYDAQDKYLADEEEFGRKLEKCRLKESTGWLASWGSERTGDYKEVPGVVRLYVYMYDPYSGPGKDLVGYPEMFIVDVSDERVPEMKPGQRIRFSGGLALVDRHEFVRNAKYELLEDEPLVQTPTDDKLTDLQITLERTMCFGTCPDYTLTIASDGQVTFEGRYYTRVKGTATATVDRAALIELAREIKKADFFSLDEHYSAEVTDNPTYRLSVRMGGQTKTVENYATGPRRLYLLQDRIDQLVNSDQWIRCDDGSCRE